MPGVPSGRGCDACRRQKKKCDQARPACSRCARLNLECVGAGQLRYLFKVYDGAKRGHTRERSSSAEATSDSGSFSLTVNARPSSELTVLTSALINAIRPATNLRFNLAWTYGDIFQDLPKRLGRNKALDASISALVNAHSDFCMRRRELSPQTLRAHGEALSTVRVCLDDPSIACQPETLCAVYVLLICQAFTGATGDSCVSHTEGAAQLLKARGNRASQDDFERLLLMTLRGPVIFEGVFNPNIKVSPSEWDILLSHNWDYAGWDGHLLRCLASVPALLQRGRNVKLGAKDNHLMLELQERYEVIRMTVDKLRDRLFKLETSLIDTNLETTHLTWQRSYGLALFVALVIGCILDSLSHSQFSISLDSAQLATEVIILAEHSHIYRPMGSAYIPLCLVAAYAGTSDPTSRVAIVELLNDYCQDFPYPETSFSIDELEKTTRRLRLRDIGPFPDTRQLV